MEYTERFKQNILKDATIANKCFEYLTEKGMCSSEIGDTTVYKYVSCSFKNGVSFGLKCNNIEDGLVNITEKVLLLDENGMWEN